MTVENIGTYEEMSEDQKIVVIDNMNHYEMARVWRHSPLGHPLLRNAAGRYFQDRLFNKFNGIPPTLSKQIGWGD